MKKNNYITYLENLDDSNRLANLYYKDKQGKWCVEVNSDLAKRPIELDIVLSANNLALVSLVPPKNYQKHGNSFLLNLLESDISQPIEKIEAFVVSEHKTHITVAVIDNKRWETLQTEIAQLGWQLGNVWIDALCLPLNDKRASLFAITSQHILWRNAADHIFSGTLSLLEQTEAYQTDTSHWLNAKGTDESNDKATAIRQLLSWAQSTNTHFKIQSTEKKSGKKTIVIGIILLLALGLGTANLYLKNQHNKQLADDYYNESVTLFHQVLPQYRKIPSRSYLTKQLDKLLDSKPKEQTIYWHWLQILSENINTNEVELLSIDYSVEPMRMEIVMQTPNNEWLQHTKNELSHHLTIKQLSTKQVSNSIVSTFEITQ